ncbi:hypothetical protein HPB48_024641 [Haemaphysalis longicornis]|uniref:TRAM1-like protein domain-containing protein n=1 Tax=Haemaphysalis longicornis TaxID=44386 RepID=A0A9J6GYA7_HAELO|nr:hypothetical protein HPB48_024641 [Haemaphysalis longicornis]
MALKRRTGSKNPPIFSHEFVIQNHADIVSCVAMLFVMGLLFQVTAPYASVFIAVHHNVTDGLDTQGVVNYTYGAKDLCLTFFYFLIAIVMHAIVQEYLLDKLNRKMHLSKMKHSKFNESGQLLIFYLVSFLWGADIIRKARPSLGPPRGLLSGNLTEHLCPRKAACVSALAGVLVA